MWNDEGPPAAVGRKGACGPSPAPAVTNGTPPSGFALRRQPVERGRDQRAVLSAELVQEVEGGEDRDRLAGGRAQVALERLAEAAVAFA